MAVFVNPYTFVPQAYEPVRHAPAGHAVMGDGRFSGVLKVRLTARTPLLIGGFTEQSPDGTHVGVPPRRKSPEDAVMIPGSGLAGAVRSLHEAMTGSCLRVVDLDFRPVHRHPVNGEEIKDLRLAVVAEVDSQGRATRVKICDDWVRIPENLLPGAIASPAPAPPGLPQTGDQLAFEPDSHMRGDVLPERVREDITRIRRMAPVTEDCWVLLVTDTNARPVRQRNGKPAPARFAAGRVGPDSRSYEVSLSAWNSYRATVQGADDLRRENLMRAGNTTGEEPPWSDTLPPEYADVLWPPPQAQKGRQGEVIARRLRARSYLHVGQPVWVRLAEGEVSEIRLSLFWRYLADKTVGERVGRARPCTDPANLCWSCCMFGSADTEGRADDDSAGQRGYRGHVRIDDLIATSPVQPITWQLAPLASPKPSAGQFYLDNAGLSDSVKLPRWKSKPTATWGSIADSPRARPIRGRKFYWRTATEADAPEAKPVRGRRRPHQSEAMSGSVELIPPGTVFEGRIAFDNLDAAEYGSLLAALDPRSLQHAGEAGWENAVISIGGGKPFGFGSAVIDIQEAWLQTAAQRYLGEESGNGAQPPSEAEAIGAFWTAVRSTEHDSGQDRWGALRHALEFGFIDDTKVWYPSGGGERGGLDYDKSYEFFARTTGLRLGGDRYRELISLPDAAGSAADQELDSAAGEHDGRQFRLGWRRSGDGGLSQESRQEPNRDR